MVEEILGKNQAEDIFVSAMITGLMSEKQACGLMESIEKNAGAEDVLKFLKGLWGAGTGLVSAGWNVAKEFPGMLGLTAATGAGLGLLGANAYDAIQKRIAEEDPETTFNEEKENIYKAKERELSDARWMSRARRIRDGLKRAAKSRLVTNEKYRKDYESLIETLKERA